MHVELQRAGSFVTSERIAVGDLFTVQDKDGTTDLVFRVQDGDGQQFDLVLQSSRPGPDQGPLPRWESVGYAGVSPCRLLDFKVAARPRGLLQSPQTINAALLLDGTTPIIGVSFEMQGTKVHHGYDLATGLQRDTRRLFIYEAWEIVGVDPDGRTWPVASFGP